MRKYHLTARIRRANPYAVLDRMTQVHCTFKNQLNRQFKPGAPFKSFCTDITYLPYQGNMAYLSAIKDIGSGEIVGWHLSDHPDIELVRMTVENMRKNGSLPLPTFRNVLIHSDQGYQYTHPEYIKVISELRMVQSMSRKGNCLDNAPMESFFGHLKDEIDYKSCRTFEELKELVASYMEYYNCERHQWNLKKMTPVEYRNHLLMKAA